MRTKTWTECQRAVYRTSSLSDLLPKRGVSRDPFTHTNTCNRKYQDSGAVMMSDTNTRMHMHANACTHTHSHSHTQMRGWDSRIAMTRDSENTHIHKDTHMQPKRWRSDGRGDASDVWRDQTRSHWFSLPQKRACYHNPNCPIKGMFFSYRKQFYNTLPVWRAIVHLKGAFSCWFN